MIVPHILTTRSIHTPQYYQTPVSAMAYLARKGYTEDNRFFNGPNGDIVMIAREKDKSKILNVPYRKVFS
jgi:hypothetical protein